MSCTRKTFSYWHGRTSTTRYANTSTNFEFYLQQRQWLNVDKSLERGPSQQNVGKSPWLYLFLVSAVSHSFKALREATLFNPLLATCHKTQATKSTTYFVSYVRYNFDEKIGRSVDVCRYVIIVRLERCGAVVSPAIACNLIKGHHNVFNKPNTSCKATIENKRNAIHLYSLSNCKILFMQLYVQVPNIMMLFKMFRN